MYQRLNFHSFSKQSRMSCLSLTTNYCRLKRRVNGLRETQSLPYTHKILSSDSLNEYKSQKFCNKTSYSLHL